MQLSNTNFSDAYLSDRLYNHPPENNEIQTTASDFANGDILTAEMRRDSNQFLKYNNTSNNSNNHYKYMKRYPPSESPMDKIHNISSGDTPIIIGGHPIGETPFKVGTPVDTSGGFHANYIPTYSYFTSFEETDSGLLNTTVGDAVTSDPASTSVPLLSPSLGGVTSSIPFGVGIVGMTPGLSGGLSKSSTTSSSSSDNNVVNAIKEGISDAVNKITSDISNIVSNVSSSTSTTTTTTSDSDPTGTDTSGNGTPVATPDSNSSIWIILLIILVAIGIVVLVYFGYRRYKKHKYIDYARY